MSQLPDNTEPAPRRRSTDQPLKEAREYFSGTVGEEDIDAAFADARTVWEPYASRIDKLRSKLGL